MPRPTHHPNSPLLRQGNHAGAAAEVSVVDAKNYQLSGRGAATVWSADSIQQSLSAKVLLFESHQQRFALTTDTVVEVIEVPQYASVPGAPGWFCGVAAYRARPVSVIDPVQYFVPANDKPDAVHTRAIAITIASSTWLLAAERVLNLCRLDAADYSHSDHNLAAHCAVSAVCNIDNKPVVLINTPEFLRQVHLLQAFG